MYANFALPMTAAGDGTVEVSLPVGYLDAAHKAADRQIALAGLRLADTLNALSLPPVSVSSPLPTPGAAPPNAVTGAASGAAAAQGSIVGNKRTHVYHLSGDGHLPAERNRVYFQTEGDARAAGYHPVGGGG